MFGMSFGHMLILLVVVLLLFGARRLPELGSSLGKGLRAFKKGLEEDEPRRVDQDSTHAHHQNDTHHDNKPKS